MPSVLLETSMGNIKIELNPEKAPITVENFLTYVREGHYNGLIFHRVIGDFAIQGGGYTEKMAMRPTNHPPIRCEAANGLNNDRGTVAMARTDVPDSATAQFFINTVNNKTLNHLGDDPYTYGYAVFGKVVEGMEVVNRIQRVQTVRIGRFDDVPKEPIFINRASVVEE
jgi:cyclophilin family peptidyl-prolyl cis-trans isomerase